MKIINKDTQNDILKRVAAMQIMAEHLPMPMEYFEKFCEHLSSIAMDVGGEKGTTLVLITVREYRKKEKKNNVINNE